MHGITCSFNFQTVNDSLLNLILQTLKKAHHGPPIIPEVGLLNQIHIAIYVQMREFTRALTNSAKFFAVLALRKRILKLANESSLTILSGTVLEAVLAGIN